MTTSENDVDFAAGHAAAEVGVLDHLLDGPVIKALRTRRGRGRDDYPGCGRAGGGGHELA